MLPLGSLKPACNGNPPTGGFQAAFGYGTGSLKTQKRPRNSRAFLLAGLGGLLLLLHALQQFFRRAFFHFVDFDVKHQHGIGGDFRAGRALAVGQVGGDVEGVFSAFFHQLQAFDPALDYGVVHQRYGKGILAFVGVEHFAVGQAAFVFHGYHVAFGGLGAAAFFVDFVLQAGSGGLHAFLTFVFSQEFLAGFFSFAGFFLGHGFGFFAQRLGKLLRLLFADFRRFAVQALGDGFGQDFGVDFDAVAFELGHHRRFAQLVTDQIADLFGFGIQAGGGGDTRGGRCGTRGGRCGAGSGSAGSSVILNLLLAGGKGENGGQCAGKQSAVVFHNPYILFIGLMGLNEPSGTRPNARHYIQSGRRRHTGSLKALLQAFQAAAAAVWRMRRTFPIIARFSTEPPVMTTAPTAQMQELFAAAGSLKTVRDLLRFAVSRFYQAGLFFGHGSDNAYDEAAYLILHTLHLPPDTLEPYLDAELLPQEREAVLAVLARRVLERIPAAYITNEAWQGEFDFYVDERVLVPRSFISELLGEPLLPWLEHEELVHRALDLCTGSGCLAVQMAHHYPAAEIDAADISLDALEVAAINVERYGLEERINLIHTDLFEGLDGAYDLIVSNPPYVDAESVADLPEEYLCEPEIALGSGEDGLDAVRRILDQAAALLNPRGVLLVEIGHNRDVLEAAFPELPFVWLETSGGDGFVFLLTREQLLGEAAF